MRRFHAMLISAALATSAITHPAMAQTEVETHGGRVAGITEGAVLAFKGIPFAQPPVGDLRWRAPQPVDRWPGVRAADRYGPDCMQIPYKADAAPLGVKPAEDCLYLNVWKPAASAAKPRPVMVWIYGGGFVNGGSSPPVYAGTKFAEADVVFVSFNYRLGRFGFFAHPALTQEAAGAPSGNYAILDQIAALQWVRDNIAAFGGDPDNVTIFGESAGGASVHALMTTPLARGLFHKAIVLSGGGRDLMGPLQSAADAEATGSEFARTKGVEGSDGAALAALRALPADSVMSGLNLMSLFGAKDFTPLFADGQIVQKSVDDAYAAGDGAAVPIVIGANDADGFFFGGGIDAAYAPLAPVRAAAEKVYDPEGKQDAAHIGVAVSADLTFLEPARHVAKIIAGRGQPVFTYRFGYVPEYLRSKLPGALHASELPFVFDTVEVRHGAATTDRDRAAARIVHDYWVNFAKTGVPSSAAGGAWARYGPAADNIMIFDAAGARERADPIRPRLDFVEGVANAAKAASKP
ncbi:para-nitrobenzyl esterase [Sphingopyxis panaciterrae]|uniref:carboxylesterase/lipase family protein n=1 Tax=Sphingopyxis panaciterrae TaxID=363841 RepID=UPI001FB93D1C|nr:carboxylesterase family protein [Sphingopyxis panaciterrae]NIJ35921.1 para-nitrobenzyl esterase [Sphingopyxis panaciterrae]